MKKIFFTISILFLFVSTQYAQTIAFPGAEGFGKFAKGARASTTPTIYHVTNLKDSGTGSLRDAISQPNRIIVFDVGGIIKISSRLIFSSNITVAGQTAPGDGIVVYGNGVSFSGAKDVIVRHMRFRMGLNGDSGKDAAGIANGSEMIFDHCSFTWGRDETFSISWDNKGTEPGNITIQNSIIGQGIMIHSAGGLIQTNGGITLYKNLYIDNKTRNPKVKGLNQYVNNVVYNWGSGGGYILGDTEGNSWASIKNNYFIKGPSTGGTDAFVRANNFFQVSQKDNYLDYTLDGNLNGRLAVEDDFGPATFVADDNSFVSTPKQHPIINNLLSAEAAYLWIVDSVGPVIPTRDEVDKYMINELSSLGAFGALINGEADLGLANGVGNVFSAKKLIDTDNDGIPDIWEDANGLNKADPSDALLVHSDSYLNIERYVNGITAGEPFVKYPTLVGVKGIDTDFIILKWVNNASTSTAVVIEQSLNNTDFTEIARISASAIDFKVINLTPNTSYYYRLKTINGETESMYTTSLKATTTGVASLPVICSEPFPADLSLISSFSQVALSWTNVTGNWAGVLSYDVFVGKTETELVQVATGITASSCSIPLEPSTTYYWRVDATNLMGKQLGTVWSFTSGKKPEREKVAYFSFDETSGTSATNDIQGFASAQNFTPTWETGQVNNCVTIPANPTNAALVQSHYDDISLGNESFTIELWFKSAGGAVDWYLIHKGSHVANSSTGTTGKWIGIQYNKTGSNDRLTWGIDDDVTKTALDITGSTFFNNKWHHLVVMRDVEANVIRMYVDGVLKGSKTDATGNIAQVENLVIGNTNVNFVNAFGGSIDEVSIYKGALTAEEILESFNNGLKTEIIPLSVNNFIQTYPNPFVNELVIKSDKLNTPLAEVNLYSVAGQLIYSKQEIVLNNTISIKGLNNILSGVYLCVVKCEGKETLSARIIK